MTYLHNALHTLHHGGLCWQYSIVPAAVAPFVQHCKADGFGLGLAQRELTTGTLQNIHPVAALLTAPDVSPAQWTLSTELSTTKYAKNLPGLARATNTHRTYGQSTVFQRYRMPTPGFAANRRTGGPPVWAFGVSRSPPGNFGSLSTCPNLQNPQPWLSYPL